MRHGNCKLTPEIAQEILDVIVIGGTYELACSRAGITAATFRRWRDVGAHDYENGIESDFSIFYNALKKAEGDFVVGCLEVMQVAMPDNWQASAWHLERVNKARYGRDPRKQVEVLGNTINEKIESIMKHVTDTKISPEEGAKMVSILQAGQAIEHNQIMMQKLELLEQQLANIQISHPQEAE